MQEQKDIVWETYVDQDSPKCFMGCKETINKATFKCGYVLPRSQEGPNSIFNLRPLCLNCYENYKGKCLLDCYIENVSFNGLIDDLKSAESYAEKDLIDFLPESAPPQPEPIKPIPSRQSSAKVPFAKTSHELMKRIYNMIEKTYEGRDKICDDDLIEFAEFKTSPIKPLIAIKKEIYNKLLKYELYHIYETYCDKNLITKKVRKSYKKSDIIEALLAIMDK